MHNHKANYQMTINNSQLSGCCNYAKVQRSIDRFKAQIQLSLVEASALEMRMSTTKDTRYKIQFTEAEGCCCNWGLGRT